MLIISNANSGKEDNEINQNSLALFKDSLNPVDSITNAIDLLDVVRENYSTENQDHGVWLALGVVGDSVRAAVARMTTAN